MDEEDIQLIYNAQKDFVRLMQEEKFYVGSKLTLDEGPQNLTQLADSYTKEFKPNSGNIADVFKCHYRKLTQKASRDQEIEFLKQCDKLPTPEKLMAAQLVLSSIEAEGKKSAQTSSLADKLRVYIVLESGKNPLIQRHTTEAFKQNVNGFIPNHLHELLDNAPLENTQTP